jgi:glycerophosphoryl diester phosphodiesterase
MIQSFDWRTLELVHKLEPGMRTVYLTVESPEYDTVRDDTWTAGRRPDDHGASVPRMVRASAGAAPGVIWSPAYQSLTPARLAEAKALGLVVVPWTVNDPATMERLIDWGVDGLITDYPDRLREVMARRGMALPPPVVR